MRLRLNRRRQPTAMADTAVAVHVAEVHVPEPEVAALVEALTVELSLGGYGPGETFGYSVEQLETGRVYLVGVRLDGSVSAWVASSCTTVVPVSSSGSSSCPTTASGCSRRRDGRTDPIRA
jgi:hypothetical protein